jgi:hypothetical protein
MGAYELCPPPPDCNENGTDDAIDIAGGASADCNQNGIPDECDIAGGSSKDLDGDGRPDECGGVQRPGDVNGDATTDMSDAVWLLGHLFLGMPGQEKLPCEGGTASAPGSGDLALADFNGDGAIDVSDSVGVLKFLFLGAAPPALGTDCVRIAGCPDNSGCR